jgi:hypothetical protein
MGVIVLEGKADNEYDSEHDEETRPPSRSARWEKWSAREVVGGEIVAITITNENESGYTYTFKGKLISESGSLKAVQKKFRKTAAAGYYRNYIRILVEALEPCIPSPAYINF